MRRLLAAGCAAVLLAGCGGAMTPAERLQDKTAALVDQANGRDLAGLRAAASDLRAEIEDQLRGSQLTPARADLLLRLLSTVERDAPLVNGEPSPTPSATPSATPSPTPSATPSATPSPTPSATPSATPTPTPVETTPVILPTFTSPTPTPTPTPTP